MEDIKKQEDINFEDKIAKAKELLEKLSNPQITINESLKLYNDGLKELELAQKLLEEAPHSELFEYAIDLRAMTQAKGSFTMEFSKYEEVPSMVSEKIIADYKAQRESN